MGHTGPLAAFAPESLPNIADYVKENVAVVTNPAIDREREAEHFSTRVILGSRPDIAGERSEQPFGLLLETPLLLDSGDFPRCGPFRSPAAGGDRNRHPALCRRSGLFYRQTAGMPAASATWT